SGRLHLRVQDRLDGVGQLDPEVRRARSRNKVASWVVNPRREKGELADELERGWRGTARDARRTGGVLCLSGSSVHRLKKACTRRRSTEDVLPTAICVPLSHT